MHRLFSGNIRRTLTLLVCLAILPALLIIFYSGIEYRNHMIRDTEREVLFLAESMAVVQKGYFTSTHQMMAALARSSEVKQFNGEAAGAVFKSLVEKNSAYINIVATDINGDVFAAALPFEPTNLADRPHIQRAVTEKQFVTGEYIITRVGQIRPTLPFAYPVLDDDGEVIGVLGTAMHLEHLAHSFDVNRLPENSFIAVTDSNGIRLFYHPAREDTNPVGRPIIKAVWDKARNTKDPGIVVHEGSDRVRRIFAFYPVSLSDNDPPCMFMWAGIPESAVLGPANMTLVRNMVLMAAAGILAIAIAWLTGRKILIHPVNRLINAMTAFAGGNHDSRSHIKDNPGELGTLARAFDTMADRLVQSQKTLRSIADYTYDWEYWRGPDGDILWMSPSCEKITGYSPDDFLADPGLINHIVHDQDKRLFAEHSDHEKIEQYQNVLDFQIIHKSEKPVWINHHCQSIYDTAGNFLGRRVSNRDITDRKLMETRLQQAQKMEAIGALAGGIAHDFNNILFPIMGLSEILLEDLPRDSLEWNNVTEIYHAAGRARDLVAQISSFSRQVEHRKVPLQVQQVIKEVIKMTRATIPSNIEFHTDIQQDCGPVLADPTNIHQVAMNLITNAFHAVEENSGQISIRLRQISVTEEDRSDIDLTPGPHVLLTVSDTGAGIPKEILPKIFNPYFTTKPQGKGTGLGLSVVFGIVKDHGGDIRVYSESGKGTEFNVYLPLLERKAAAGRPEVAVTCPSGTERVLLVDDEEPIARLEKQMLERLGYQVTASTGSMDALQKFKADPMAFDIVITDMAMPHMTGDELARQLIAIRPDIPVILCTGFSEQTKLDRAGDAGIRGFLMKPVLREELATKIRTVLDG